MTYRKRILRGHMAATFAALVASCSDQGSSIEIDRNAAHKDSYAMSIKIHGSPVAFDSASARAFYEVTNESCAPRNGFSGVRNVPNRAVNLELKKESDSQYRSSFELSPFADKDYFGKGVCHWSITSIGFSGVKGKMTILASFSTDDMKRGSTSTNYFLKSIFDHASSRLNIGGLLEPTAFGSGAQTFSVEMTAKKATRD